MPYAMLAAAILAEVGATTSLKFSQGFTKLWLNLRDVVAPPSARIAAASMA